MKNSKKTAQNIVLFAIMKVLKTTFSKLNKKTKRREFVYNKQIAIFCLVNYTGLTFEKIGEMFNLDHSSISYTHKKILGEISLKHNSQLRETINAIENIISFNNIDDKTNSYSCVCTVISTGHVFNCASIDFDKQTVVCEQSVYKILLNLSEVVLNIVKI